MAAAPKPYSSITVSSGALCYGSLHNIWHGASVPIQGFSSVRSHRSGTVQVHDIEYNTAAQNGVWNIYRIMYMGLERVSAWFLCHSDIDPVTELDKILTVSGSPYDIDSGSRRNDDGTEASGVFVINRYDWGYYDARSWDEIGNGEPEGDDDILANDNSLGIADYAVARAKVSHWRTQRPTARRAGNDAVWLHILHGEYMFGRFGFDADRTAARSFLYFAAFGRFADMAFEGTQTRLRIKETLEERFFRRLREGADFSGLTQLYERIQPDEDGRPCPWFIPEESQRCGPFDASEHVLTAEDMEVLRSHVGVQHPHMQGRVREFVAPWDEPLFDLVNEMILGFLMCMLSQLKRLPNAAPAEAMFPMHNDAREEKSVTHEIMHRHFMEPDSITIPNFDAEGVRERIRRFMNSQTADAFSVVITEDIAAGLCRGIERMVTELLFSSHDATEACLVPEGIRMVALNGWLFSEFLLYSKVFWDGRGPEQPS